MQTRKWMTIAAVLALTSSLAFAGSDAKDEAATSQAQGQSYTGRNEGLGLTAAQQEQIHKLEAKFRSDAVKAYKAADVTRGELRAAREAGDTAKAKALKETLSKQRAQLRDLRTALDTAIDGVLTAEQRTKVKAANESATAGKGLDTRTAAAAKQTVAQTPAKPPQ